MPGNGYLSPGIEQPLLRRATGTVAYNGVNGCQPQAGQGPGPAASRASGGRLGSPPQLRRPLRGPTNSTEIKKGQIHMYLQEIQGQRSYGERLQEAQRYRVVSQARALRREQRRLVRAERQMSRAHARARRIQLELEAEL